MFKLEHGAKDQNSAEAAKPRLAKLFARNESTWSDTFTANQKLRAEFRKKSQELKTSAALDKALLIKSSLDIPLLPEREEDKRMATLLSMKLKPSLDISTNTELSRKRILNAPSLPTATTSFTTCKRLKALKDSSLGRTLGIVKKSTAQSTATNEGVNRSLVGDYGSSSSESDS